MADIEPTDENFSSDMAALAGKVSTPTGLMEGTYTCPECGAVVVKIEGNTMKFLYSHIRDPTAGPDEQGYVSLVFCRTIFDSGMFMPPREYVPPLNTTQPYLSGQSSAMKSTS